MTQDAGRRTQDKIIVALDVNSLKEARSLVDKLYPTIKIFKVGNELFTACGPDAVRMVQKKGAKVFLDLKFHDIPNTVAKAVKAAMKLNVFMINVHACGGSDMIKAAVSARGRIKRPIILAVTVLTSQKALLNKIKSLALLAKSNKADGVVCSAHEAKALRKICGKNFILVTPGIRLKTSPAQDQKRIATPEYAFKNGADYIVVGRPITEAKDPLAAAKKIINKS